MKSVAVFCASSIGHDPIYAEQSVALGHFLASQGVKLVYGGGQVGLMGILANAVLQQGGQAIGVIPGFLDTKEIGHTGLTQLHVVENMHERKKLMHDLSDGFIALPGGFGTLEELFEILTWAQLGLHKKPIGILNSNGFYDKLIDFMNNMTEQGLLKKENLDMLLVSDTISDLWEKMQNYVAPSVPKWIANKSQL
ncbi:TIGR00730 family Rossman fold protein [Olivibacter sitiensis]|uniref:LOG family protein n=1 Tax=Olivibacter sitiensis TaxID=376470 RepID=UPI0003F68566|nr:TIGR00730 family Rossman fold protein [Olivibacter sitiensis]